ncbi:MAG: hypothetical protein N3F05_01945 [Candidatus Diapherotrites archaeon]|nr:hypothetical protein [Candidatus Diapherotrites archaeon]
MLIIAVVGLARSGKDTFANYLERRYGFKRFDFYSDVIVPMMREQKIKPTKANAAKFGNSMRQKFGMGVFGQKMAQIIRGNDKVVVTGARSLEELSELEKASEKFFIIKIEASKELRFSRRSDLDPKNENDFFARDTDDLINKGLDKVLRASELVIKNNSTIADFEKAIDDIMKRI